MNRLIRTWKMADLLSMHHRIAYTDPPLASVTISSNNNSTKPSTHSSYRISLSFTDLLFVTGLGIASVGVFRLSRWNKRRLKEKEEKRKAADKAREERVCPN